MLELKDVTLKDDEGQVVVNGFNLLLERGNMFTINASHQSAAYRVFMAILGLHPVEKGYVTLDGEPVTIDSARYLRTMMSLVPYPSETDGKLTLSEQQCRFLFEVDELDHPVVLADDPTAFQDEKGQQEIAERLRRIANENRMVLVLSGNDFVHKLSDKVIVLA